MPFCWDVPCASAHSGVQSRKAAIKNPSRVLAIGNIPGVGVIVGLVQSGGQPDGGIIADGRDGFQCHVTHSLDRPFIVLFKKRHQ
jgi:hypothetical protein